MSIDIMSMFQSFRTILCVCPRCEDIVRFSDLRIEYKGKTIKTWLDEYEAKVHAQEKKEEKSGEQEEELRAKARERGRKQVPKLVQRSMHTEFAKLKYDPYDIKAILHPIDFVVFDGLNQEKMKDVIFLSKKTDNAHLNKIRTSVEAAVAKGAYDWQTARVDIGGSIKFE